MLINTEEKAKIAVLCIIGTALVCNEHFVMAGGCFAVLLPWSALGRVTSWLAEPIVNWRLRRGKRAPEPVEAAVNY
ncbi:MAG: hypothetical protein WAO35_02510 [Terriglobia bacterium]